MSENGPKFTNSEAGGEFPRLLGLCLSQYGEPLEPVEPGVQGARLGFVLFLVGLGFRV